MSRYNSVIHDMYRALMTHVMYFFLRPLFWQRVLLYSRLMSGLMYMRVYFWHIILKMSGQERESCLFCPLFWNVRPSLPTTRGALAILFQPQQHPPHLPCSFHLTCTSFSPCADTGRSVLWGKRKQRSVDGGGVGSLTPHRAPEHLFPLPTTPPHLPCSFHLTCTSFPPCADTGGVCYEAKDSSGAWMAKGLGVLPPTERLNIPSLYPEIFILHNLPFTTCSLSSHNV
jgi:hypothetical protein